MQKVKDKTKIKREVKIMGEGGGVGIEKISKYKYPMSYFTWVK